MKKEQSNKQETDLYDRRGKIAIAHHSIVKGFREQTLKAIFSNFFPVAIENNHDLNMYGTLVFYGYSPHFRNVAEGEKPPEYQIRLKDHPDKDVEFDGMEEVKELNND